MVKRSVFGCGTRVHRSAFLITRRFSVSGDLQFPLESERCLSAIPVVGTLLHELSHIIHGPHAAPFYKLLDEITGECEELMAKGISGRNGSHVEAFSGVGTPLAPSRPTVPRSKLSEVAARAAVARAGKSFDGHRLGGATQNPSASPQHMVVSLFQHFFFSEQVPTPCFLM
eukprot:m.105271 g.105271  ORF g.105271 m.105271 type:complete len:171 (+) comp51639_c0_seq4:354-866(+)